jgi:hypothetical protein
MWASDVMNDMYNKYMRYSLNSRFEPGSRPCSQCSPSPSTLPSLGLGKATRSKMQMDHGTGKRSIKRPAAPGVRSSQFAELQRQIAIGHWHWPLREAHIDIHNGNGAKFMSCLCVRLCHDHVCVKCHLIYFNKLCECVCDVCVWCTCQA